MSGSSRRGVCSSQMQSACWTNRAGCQSHRHASPKSPSTREQPWVDKIASSPIASSKSALLSFIFLCLIGSSTSFPRAYFPKCLSGIHAMLGRWGLTNVCLSCVVDWTGFMGVRGGRRRTKKFEGDKMTWLEYLRPKKVATKS